MLLYNDYVSTIPHKVRLRFHFSMQRFKMKKDVFMRMVYVVGPLLTENIQKYTIWTKIAC